MRRNALKNTRQGVRRKKGRSPYVLRAMVLHATVPTDASLLRDLLGHPSVIPLFLGCVSPGSEATIGTKHTPADHPNAVFLEMFSTNFRELRHGEVRRMPLPRTCVNKDEKIGGSRLLYAPTPPSLAYRTSVPPAPVLGCPSVGPQGSSQAGVLASRLAHA